MWAVRGNENELCREGKWKRQNKNENDRTNGLNENDRIRNDRTKNKNDRTLNDILLLHFNKY
jgi:hypothetical protein